MSKLRTITLKNKESFRVNEELVKFKYIKFSKKHKQKSRLKRLFISKGKK